MVLVSLVIVRQVLPSSSLSELRKPRTPLPIEVVPWMFANGELDQQQKPSDIAEVMLAGFVVLVCTLVLFVGVLVVAELVVAVAAWSSCSSGHGRGSASSGRESGSGTLVALWVMEVTTVVAVVRVVRDTSSRQP